MQTLSIRDKKYLLSQHKSAISESKCVSDVFPRANLQTLRGAHDSTHHARCKTDDQKPVTSLPSMSES